jgi:hypothetical protein
MQTGLAGVVSSTLGSAVGASTSIAAHSTIGLAVSLGSPAVGGLIWLYLPRIKVWRRVKAERYAVRMGTTLKPDEDA